MTSLISFDEARERILQSARLLKPSRYQPIEEGLGQILADDIVAPINVPGRDNSAMDGIALFAESDLPSGTRIQISDRVAAGSSPKPLRSGSAARIFTGAVLPEGANSVVPQEQIRPLRSDLTDKEPVQIARVGDLVELTAEVIPGQHVRKAGCDIPAGNRVIHRGTRLSAAQIGVLASLGIESIPLYEPLSVGIMCSGDELVSPGQPLAPGQIYDSNSYLLTALARQSGMQPTLFDAVADDLESTIESLVDAAAQVDVLITSGGVSVGEEDHVRKAMQQAGELDIWRIAVKPGKPLAVGSIGETPCFGLPGNPVSSFVTYLVLVLPFLKLCAGQAVNPVEPVLLPASFERAGGSRTEFLRARLERGKLYLYPNQGSAVLTSVAWAHGLVRQDAGQDISPGDLLPYWSLSELM